MEFIAAANWTEYEIEGADQPQLCTVSPSTNYPNSHSSLMYFLYLLGFWGVPPESTVPTSTDSDYFLWSDVSIDKTHLTSVLQKFVNIFCLLIAYFLFCAIVNYFCELFLHSFTVISLRLQNELEINVGIETTILL